MTTFRIAASILSCDLTRPGEEVRSVVAAGADWIHFDVMDNHCVPNLSFGPMVCAALRKHAVRPDASAVPIDLHLMVRPFDALAQARKIIDACGRDVRLEVDGGVKVENIRQIADAGADTFVSGSAIFGSGDYRRTIEAARAIGGLIREGVHGRRGRDGGSRRAHLAVDGRSSLRTFATSTAVTEPARFPHALRT